MDKEILKLLGYSDDDAQKIIDKATDAPTDVLERLRTALAEKAALSNDLEAAKKDGEEKDKQLEAAKTELANSRAALKKSQTARAELVVANAIRGGKLAEFQRRGAVKILANSDDFETDEAELAKAPDAVKTKSETDGIAAAENAGEKAKSDLRAKFDAYAKASDFTRPKGEVLTAKEVLYDNRNVVGGKIRVSTPLETLDYRSFEFLCGLDEVGFATEKLTVGDEFFLDRPYKRLATDYYACRSSMMTVSRREGDLVYAKAASFANSYTGDTYSAKAILFDNRNVDGGIIFVRAPTKRWGERSLQVSVRRETAFFAAKPEIREKFAPTDQLTGIETGQIDSGTTPSYKDYRQLMASGGEIRSAPSTVEEVYKGLWRRDDFYTVAR